MAVTYSTICFEDRVSLSTVCSSSFAHSTTAALLVSRGGTLGLSFLPNTPFFFFFRYSDRNQQVDYSVAFEREVALRGGKNKHLCSRFGGP